MRSSLLDIQDLLAPCGFGSDVADILTPLQIFDVVIYLRFIELLLARRQENVELSQQTTWARRLIEMKRRCEVATPHLTLEFNQRRMPSDLGIGHTLHPVG